MKKIKRLVSLACAIAIGTVAMVGCGSAKTSSTQNKKVEVVFWEQDDEAVRKVYDVLIKDWNAKNPNIQIKKTHYNTEDLRNNFTTAAMGGNGPDIVFGPSDNLGVFVPAGLIQPLEDVMGADYFKKFDSAALTAAKYEGKQYMLPDRNGNELFLIYNKKYVSEAPKTWEEMIEIGKKLKQEGKIQYPLTFDLTQSFFILPYLNAFGGSLFDDLSSKNPKPNFNNAAGIKWFAFIKSLVDDGVVNKSGDVDVAKALFREGKTAFYVNGPWEIGALSNDKKWELGKDYDFIPLPSINGVNPAATCAPKGYMVSSSVTDATKKEAVKKVLEFFNNKESQIALVKGHNQAPTNLEALSDPSIKNNAAISKQADVLKLCVPMPTIPQMRGMWDAMTATEQEVLAGKLTAEQAAQKAQKRAEDAIAAQK